LILQATTGRALWPRWWPYRHNADLIVITADREEAGIGRHGEYQNQTKPENAENLMEPELFFFPHKVRIDFLCH